MPVTPTYPGVYVEEIPSGVRTIIGVATSITAFLGRARSGPINKPILINSFTEFERIFGGLREDYMMGYAVQDFYLNGGRQALIVRLFRDPRRNVIQALEETISSNNGASSLDLVLKKATSYPPGRRHTAAQAVADAVLQAVVDAAAKANLKAADITPAAETAAKPYTVGTPDGDAAQVVLTQVKSAATVQAIVQQALTAAAPYQGQAGAAGANAVAGAALKAVIDAAAKANLQAADIVTAAETAATEQRSHIEEINSAIVRTVPRPARAVVDIVQQYFEQNPNATAVQIAAAASKEATRYPTGWQRTVAQAVAKVVEQAAASSVVTAAETAAQPYTAGTPDGDVAQDVLTQVKNAAQPGATVQAIVQQVLMAVATYKDQPGAAGANAVAGAALKAVVDAAAKAKLQAANIVTAAETAAQPYTGDTPDAKAAQDVLTQVKNAAQPGATVQAIVQQTLTAAATAAAPYQGQAGAAGANAVAGAALKAVIDAAAKANLQAADIVTAAETAAQPYTAGTPDAKAAQDVLTQVKNAAQPEATVQAIVQQAQTTAAPYRGQPGETGANAVYKAAAQAAAPTVTDVVTAMERAAEHTIDPPLLLEAASPGSWANTLEARMNREGIDKQVVSQYASYGLNENDLFNLEIFDRTRDQRLEVIPNVTLKDAGPRLLDRVLEQSSQLVRHLVSNLPATTLEVIRQGEDSDPLTREDYEDGLVALNTADLFNLMCIPPDVRGNDTDPYVWQRAVKYCQDRRAMLLVDAPMAWGADPYFTSQARDRLTNELDLTGEVARNAALYFPHIRRADPRRQMQIDTFVPCGMVAGVMARTDQTRGVWKAPAGIDAALLGLRELSVTLTDDQNGVLNPLGINCLRTFPIYGTVVWGARTLRGADQLADEWKYIPVRRLALYIEESLFRSTKWVVFEPNDEPLWAQIRLNVGAFMHDLFRQGAFQGQKPSDAYFVRCGKDTTTQNDIDKGIVNIRVGFAPLKPAEFVILQIQQIAGEIQV